LPGANDNGDAIFQAHVSSLHGDAVGVGWGIFLSPTAFIRKAGLLIVFPVIGGSLWIMANLNHNMMPMDQLMRMQG